MATEKYANCPTPSSPSTPWTTLSAGIDNSTTTIPVVSASAFPSSAQYRITVGDEILLVTAGAGSTSWTATRGVEGSTAASHSAGAGVFLTLTAAGLLRNPGALTTTGDLSYLDSSGAPARLAAGADATYLRYASGVPTASAILSADLPDPLVVGTLRLTDTDLVRGDATGQVTLSAGSSTTSFRLKNGSNAELGALYWDSNTFVLGTKGAAGAGTARDVILGSALSAPNGIYLATEDTSRWQITPTGPLRPFADGTSATDLGDSSHKVRSAYVQKLGTLSSNGFVKTSGGDGTLSIDTTSYQAAGSYALTTSSLAQFAATTSLELKTLISDETGSGSLVFATSPTLVTPVLGTPSSGTLTNCTGLPEAGLTFTDITTANASSSQHGLMAKLSGNAYDFALGDGTYGRTVARGTITTSDPWTFTQTWNAGAVTFTAAKINVTNTASAGGSKLLDLQFGGLTWYEFSSTNLRIGKSGSYWNFVLNAATSGGSFGLKSTSKLQWTNGEADDTADVVLQRDAAQTLARRNGTNAQVDRLYTTYTDASNYERLAFSGVASSDFTIAPEAAGTGTLRGLKFGTSSGKLGFFGTSAVTQRADMVAITDSTTGTPSTTLNDVGVVFNQATIDNNFSTCGAQINKIRTCLRDLGLMA